MRRCVGRSRLCGLGFEFFEESSVEFLVLVDVGQENV